MTISLRNRWVWITGSSPGLGRWMALHGADRGARVLLSGRNVGSLQAVAAEAQARSQAAGHPGGHFPARGLRNWPPRPSTASSIWTSLPQSTSFGS